jgi:uncharacterized repeat protein (TIGR03803 family)
MNTIALLKSIPLLASLLPVVTHAAPQFSVIGTVSGGPQIGAIKGQTLYGTVPYDGYGALFSLTTRGRYTLLHSFNGTTDGSIPNARLVLTNGGDLYGTAPEGGAYNYGTLWKFSAAGGMTTPHAFGATGDGASPLQGPALGLHEALLGTTSMGDDNTNGIIFREARGNIYKQMYNFQSGQDGHCPFSGVAVGTDGAVYGTTVGNGYGGNPTGSVYKFTPAGGVTTLYAFKNRNDGEWPDQAPATDAKNNIYGTTYIQNGASFAGAIWKISAAGNFSVLYDLNGASDGFGPNSPLILNTDGNFYGTTNTGGADNYGTVFSVTPTGTFTLLYSFTNTGDGALPTGNLVHDATGAIYGGTAAGTVFKIVP